MYNRPSSVQELLLELINFAWFQDLFITHWIISLTRGSVTGFVGTLQNLMCVSILSNVSTVPSRVDPVQRHPLGLVGQLVKGLDDRPEGGVLVLHHDLQVKILLVLLPDARILF